MPSVAEQVVQLSVVSTLYSMLVILVKRSVAVPDIVGVESLVGSGLTGVMVILGAVVSQVNVIEVL